MLNVVLPKGSLEKQVLELFDAADLTVIRGGDRDYQARVDDPRIARVRFLRPQEIPTYVEQGIFDLGISGRDWVTETGADVVSLGEIGGGRAGEAVVKVVLAVPKESPWESVKDLPEGVRISTEMPETTRRFLEEHGVKGKVFTSHGATEAKIPDIVDAIVDLTETGSSLRKAGLKIIETLLTSRTELLAHRAAYEDPAKRAAMEDLSLLLQGALRARGHVLLKLNVPASGAGRRPRRAARDELPDGHAAGRRRHARGRDGRAEEGRQHAHPGAQGRRRPGHPRAAHLQDRRVVAAPVAPAPVRSTTPALAAAVLAGALIAVQQRWNGELRTALGDALLAALVSFGSGLLVVALVVAAAPRARAALPALRGVPWWSCAGGACGAALVAVSAAAAPVLGVALLSVGLVAGQTTGGIAVDRAGLGPSGRHAADLPRVAGAALCLVAVAISASGQGARDADPLLLALVLAAGFLISLQQALNGRVRAGDEHTGRDARQLRGRDRGAAPRRRGARALRRARGPGLAVRVVALHRRAARRLLRGRRRRRRAGRRGAAAGPGRRRGPAGRRAAARRGRRRARAGHRHRGGADPGRRGRRRPGRPAVIRWAKLVVGLLLFAAGLWLGLVAELGVGPWDVLTGGLSRQLGTSFGRTAIGVSVVVLVIGLLLRVRPGPGTIANVVVIGVVLDLLLGTPWLEGLDDQPLALRLLAVVGGIASVAAGSALYLGAHMGPGPRDGLMVALVERTGRPVGTCRALLECSVLVAGVLLGGPVGVGTVLFALGIGPAVQIAFRVLGQTPVHRPVEVPP